ncbi:MAG TPA: ribonuclease HII [Desulfuromonadales bacterium]|nr:ribonuclease HII [Desulfuromonadales bacterium]
MTLDLFPRVERSPLQFESRTRALGYRLIAGVDEAGRGPLAGPVVAAAVILPEQFELPGLNDSKQLSAAVRQRLFFQIRQQAAVGVGIVAAAEIDELNILQATLKAMSLAVRRLRQAADYLLVDGITPVPLPLPQKTIRQGDARSASIAAASIMAKVVRDRMMIAYDRLYPGYGFAGHKGYGSAQHLETIARLGPSPLHRRTFRGVREHLERA